MPDIFKIPVCDACKCMGDFEETYSNSVEKLLGEFGFKTEQTAFGQDQGQSDQTLGLSLAWKGNKAGCIPGFKLEIIPFSTNRAPGKFDPTEQTLIDVKSYAGQRYEKNSVSDVRLRTMHLGAGFFQSSDQLAFKVSLDTNNLTLLDTLAAGEAMYRQQNGVFAKDGEAGLYKVQVTRVESQLVTRYVFPLKLEVHRPVAPRFSTFWILVQLQFRSLPPFAGFAAIDFGNSGTTFAIKSESNTAVADLKLVPVDAGKGKARISSSPVLKSAIHFTELKAAPAARPGDPPPEPQVEWIAGDEALEQPNASRQVVSPKRYFAKDGLSPITVDDVLLSSHYPAQLLLTSVLRAAHNRQKQCFHIRPKDPRQPGITLTYPSTYSENEISRLRNTYIAAVVRAFQHKILPTDVPSPAMVDEASAAAFYFLYRDFFFSDGRIPGFTYVYPNGANILVIDVGGGTTDVALVNCCAVKQIPGHPHPTEKKSQPNSAAKTKEFVIKMNVLGRTGLRHFGGDNITVAVFKVLKAELAFHVTGDAELECPANISFLEWYDGTDDRPGKTSDIDVAVPTRFADPGLDRAQRRERRQLTKELWMWAEKIKAWISRQNGHKLPDDGDGQGQQALTDTFTVPGNSKLGELIKGQHSRREGSLLSDDYSTNSGDWNKKILPDRILTLIPRIEEQFSAELFKLLKVTNRMLRKRLPKDEHQFPEELHRVYIVGQAAYYPALRKRIADDLEIEIINHGNRVSEPAWEADETAWETALNSWKKFDKTGGQSPATRRNMQKLLRMLFDESELKYSVVKGAALLNFVNTAAFEAEFERDLDLADRLPFDILYETAVAGLTPVYEEGDSYTSMADRWQPLTEYKIRVDKAKGGRFLTLLQRWPGDIDNEHPDQFFEFPINQEIQGALKIQYRKAARTGGYSGFVLKDTGNPDEKEITGRYLEMLSHLPPMQRGDL